MRKPRNSNFKLGRSEYHNSKERADNPHPVGSDNYKAWDRGWMSEKKEDWRND